MSSAIGGTAIPITHYRILAKQQPAATARCVALQQRGPSGRESKSNRAAPRPLTIGSWAIDNSARALAGPA